MMCNFLICKTLRLYLSKIKIIITMINKTTKITSSSEIYNTIHHNGSYLLLFEK